LQPKEDPTKTYHFDSEASLSSDSEESDDAFEDEAGRVIVTPKRKKVKPLDHLDPKSFSWKLMNYAISALVCHDVNIFLADVGLEISGKKFKLLSWVFLCTCAGLLGGHWWSVHVLFTSGTEVRFLQYAV
jgi:hypothetical protein